MIKFTSIVLSCLLTLGIISSAHSFPFKRISAPNNPNHPHYPHPARPNVHRAHDPRGPAYNLGQVFRGQNYAPYWCYNKYWVYSSRRWYMPWACFVYYSDVERVWYKYYVVDAIYVPCPELSNPDLPNSSELPPRKPSAANPIGNIRCTYDS